MDPTTEACEGMSTIIMESGVLSHVDPQGAFRGCVPKEVFLTSGVVILSLLQQSLASATLFVLGVSG